jgi:hypothetical protein
MRPPARRSQRHGKRRRIESANKSAIQEGHGRHERDSEHGFVTQAFKKLSKIRRRRLGCAESLISVHAHLLRSRRLGSESEPGPAQHIMLTVTRVRISKTLLKMHLSLHHCQQPVHNSTAASFQVPIFRALCSETRAGRVSEFSRIADADLQRF